MIIVCFIINSALINDINSTNNVPNSKLFSDAEIAGIIVACCIGFMLLIMLVICLYKRFGTYNDDISFEHNEHVIDLEKLPDVV